MIRAFIAVPAATDLKQRLAGLQSRLAESGADIRWVAPENIHLTLVFLGDISEDVSDTITAELDRALACISPCALTVRGVGFFGKPGSPRVIWAGLQGDPEQMRIIQKQTLDAAQKAGCRPDTKPFNPHLTIGRARSTRNLQSLLDAIKSKKDACFGELIVQNILLMKSRLTPGGPKYSIIHEFKLEKP